MTDEQEIAQLMAKAPRAALSKAAIAERCVGYVAGIIAIAALVLAMIVGFSSSAIATCVNSNLGTRSAPNLADQAAQQIWLDSISKAFTDLLAQKPGAAVEFQTATNTYKQVLAEDAKKRAKNPLGHC